MSESTPPPPPEEPAAGTGAALSPADQRLWATLIHIGGIFFGFIPALVGYLVLRDKGQFVRDHTATALNFQITMTIAAIIGSILIIVVVGILIVIAVYVLILVFSIIAAVAANKGQPYTYPLSIKFVS
ncbi:hypothetical protein ARHIZOSPH14_32800 [Agromyces rhizosphaerae]|uniref:DUF4870 domain-containing protein n=1 Tax=Agromyces rhizosphaerae TaxID=88374 RepID=A0A9W6CV57_9MICO|nr:DUF4870 domain-containing protein [Agromyces rhizosphaerae]GLI29038.1 hypothetical protein ARHIZOSPH14_32800 [Agromyces rhizosphaerae]